MSNRYKLNSQERWPRKAKFHCYLFTVCNRNSRVRYIRSDLSKVVLHSIVFVGGCVAFAVLGFLTITLWKTHKFFQIIDNFENAIQNREWLLFQKSYEINIIL